VKSKIDGVTSPPQQESEVGKEGPLETETEGQEAEPQSKKSRTSTE
jgi:hypothetical protein